MSSRLKGRFDDDGYSWRYFRLWPFRRYLVWHADVWSEELLRDELRMLSNTRAMRERVRPPSRGQGWPW